MQSALALSDSVKKTLAAAVGVATRGLPAVRAGLHGARLGAGAALEPAVVERLGVQVLSDIPTKASEGARALMVHGRDGVAIALGSAGGVRAVVTESAVRAVARQTARTAFAGVLRATRQGAAAGAIVDGALGILEAAKGLKRGELTPVQAAKLAGKRTARGAVVGGASVAAAGVASAAIAATGVAFLGAPIVVPIVTMTAAGVAIGHGFDRVFGS